MRLWSSQITSAASSSMLLRYDSAAVTTRSTSVKTPRQRMSFSATAVSIRIGSEPLLLGLCVTSYLKQITSFIVDSNGLGIIFWLWIEQTSWVLLSDRWFWCSVEQQCVCVEGVLLSTGGCAVGKDTWPPPFKWQVVKSLQGTCEGWRQGHRSAVESLLLSFWCIRPRQDAVRGSQKMICC